MQKLILDASIVISWVHELEDLTVLELLLEIGYIAIIPQRVSDEIKSESGVVGQMYDLCEIKTCEEKKFQEISNRYFRLGSGEKAVIALGLELEEKESDYTCVVDDKLAREACEDESIEYTGQIGLLKILIQAGSLRIEEAVEFLSRMEDEGAWLPPDWRELLHDEQGNG